MHPSEWAPQWSFEAGAAGAAVAGFLIFAIAAARRGARGLAIGTGVFLGGATLAGFGLAAWEFQDTRLDWAMPVTGSIYALVLTAWGALPSMLGGAAGLLLRLLRTRRFNRA